MSFSIRQQRLPFSRQASSPCSNSPLCSLACTPSNRLIHCRTKLSIFISSFLSRISRCDLLRHISLSLVPPFDPQFSLWPPPSHSNRSVGYGDIVFGASAQAMLAPIDSNDKDTGAHSPGLSGSARDRLGKVDMNTVVLRKQRTLY